MAFSSWLEVLEDESVVAGTQPDFLEIERETVKLDRSLIATDLDIFESDDPSVNLKNASHTPDPDRLLEGFDHLDEVYGEWLRSWRGVVEQRVRVWLFRLMNSPDLDSEIKLTAAEALHRMDPGYEPAARHLIDNTIYQRCFGAHNGQAHRIGFTEIRQCGEIRNRDINVLETRLAVGASVARCNENGFHLFGCRGFPRQCMLAPATSNYQDIHAVLLSVGSGAYR